MKFTKVMSMVSVAAAAEPTIEMLQSGKNAPGTRCDAKAADDGCVSGARCGR